MKLAVGDRTNRKRAGLIMLLFCCITSFISAQKSAYDAVYQYTVKVEARTAYLWIPPKCSYVRGIIIAVENALERNWMESPIVRKTAVEEGLAMLWIGDGKPTSITYELKAEAISFLDKMFKDLAVESGYSEIEFAPLIFTGHSWNGRMAWNYPAARPERTIAVIPIRTYPMPDTLAFSGIPLCYIVGQTTELPQYNDGRPSDRDFFWPIVRETAMVLRRKSEDNLISVVVNPGGCHMDWTDDQSRFLSLFIRKSCHYRLPEEKPANGKVILKKISVPSGWLTDTGNLDKDKFSPAPYTKYKGDPKNAYWFFDEEMARTAVDFNGDRMTKQKQMTTFVQDGDTLSVSRNGYVQLKWIPEPDGLTFKVEGGFLKSVPNGLLDSGRSLANASAPVKLYHILGPAVQKGPDEFKVEFDRTTPKNIVLMSEQMGNRQFRRAVQPGTLMIPYKLTEGKEQKINFPVIKDQQANAKTIKLYALSSSGLPVSYYIAFGPAVIKGDVLQLTDIPVRSKFPVKVAVTAYQWGSTLPTLYKSAAPVLQDFYIRKGSQ